MEQGPPKDNLDESVAESFMQPQQQPEEEKEQLVQAVQQYHEWCWQIRNAVATEETNNDPGLPQMWVEQEAQPSQSWREQPQDDEQQ